MEIVRARERAADAALPSDRPALVRGTGSGQTEAERRASIEAQNDRELQSALNESRTTSAVTFGPTRGARGRPKSVQQRARGGEEEWKSELVHVPTP